MKLPALSELNTSRDLIDVFAGYNHNLRIGDGEFYDMKNLTSSDYPVLSPRPKRGIYLSPEKPQGMVAKDALCYVDGDTFYINEYPVNVKLSTAEEDCPKTLISMGAYVIIMPDKKYVDTTAFSTQTDFDIEKTVVTESEVSFTLCKLDGTLYKNPDGTATSEPKASPTAPTSPKNLELWIDTSSEPHTLKQYAEATEQWSPIATTYIKIESVGIGKYFSEGDGVTISGITDEALADLNTSMVIWAKGDDYIVVTGILDRVTTQDTPVCVCRWMPTFDFLIESENRLWGCKYGMAYMGKAYDTNNKTLVSLYSKTPVNELYACKLGDFKNWNCFAGLSTDSYAATVGTDGQFTGAITHLGYPLFFKENYLHKVYGNYPANYQIQTTACRGVEKGCSKSLAIVNEVLYYKARSGICAYDGSLPVEVSSAFGDTIYSDAVAGALGNKYFVSMREVSSNPIPQYHLFAFDTKRGMWHREDDTQAAEFCNCRGDLYYIDYNTNQIKTVKGTGTTEPADIEWMAETGVIGIESPDKKYISRIDIRLSLAVGARVFVHIQYDSLGDWEQVYAMTGISLRSFPIPIRPKRCDHLRMRISGIGEAKIYSICKTIEQGSDV